MLFRSENRIKLMLANARGLAKQHAEEEAREAAQAKAEPVTV